MKHRTFSFVLLSFVSLFCVTTANASLIPSPSVGQGIDYYKAGFPQVAKPLLISEIASTPSTLTETCFTLGNIYFADNQVDSAAFYFNKGLAANQENSLNAVGLAMLKIKSTPEAAEQEFQKIIKLKQNKKNVDIMIAIANSYLFNKNIEQALVYHDKAKEIKSKYAPLSVLLGDIELAKKNIGNACSNYDMAMYYDANCKEAYIKYARAYRNVNTNLAIEKLGLLKTKEPSFLLADKELADIYYANNNFPKAAEMYDSYLKSGNANAQDLIKYAFTLFLSGEFEKSLETTISGLAKEPRNPALNRLAMYNNVDLTKLYTASKKVQEALTANSEALKAADNFFFKSEKPEFSYLDYRYYGQALRDNKQIDKAIPQYLKALELDSSKVDLWKDISDMYSTQADYKSALDTYTKYIKALTDDKKTAEALMGYGKVNYNFGNDTKQTDAALKTAALQRADSAFGEVAKLEPTGYRANFWRARSNIGLDPEAKLGLAKPFYEQTATLCESKADPRYNSVLIECYNYLGSYYIIKDDNKQSLPYWNKILALDPNHAKAKEVIDTINKGSKR